MTNEYSRQWFEVFLDTMPPDWTAAEIAAIRARLPLPEFRRVLDVCCGPGRHAQPLAESGYEITGIDRDPEAIRRAHHRVPAAEFLELDMRDLSTIDMCFDAAMVLWQSFGYFDPADNDRVLAAIARLLRPRGRLLLDLFHPGYFEAHTGRTTEVRDPRCAAITNTMDGPRLTSRIEYTDGTEESMDWELFSPDGIADRCARMGLVALERCCWWDAARPPTPDEQRYQIVLEKAGTDDAA